MPIRQGPVYLRNMQIAELKKQDKAVAREVLEKQKEINESIKIVKSGKMLPLSTERRYTEKFGKKNEKKAFLHVIIIFAFCFLITFAIQPSMFFITTSSGLNLTNFSQREINNVGVYKLDEYVASYFGKEVAPVAFVDKLSPNQELQFDAKKTTVLVAFSDRQLPSMGVIINPLPPQKINTGGDSNAPDLFYRGLRQQLGTSDSNGR